MMEANTLDIKRNKIHGELVARIVSMTCTEKKFNHLKMKIVRMIFIFRSSVKKYDVFTCFIQ